MPGKIWGRVNGFRFGGQVVTAGVLLTVAAILLFSVISTFQQVSMKLPDKTLSAVDIVPPLENDEVPESIVSRDIHETASEPLEPVIPVTANTNINREAIQELWRGAKTHGFGWQLHPVYGDWRYHNGVDINGGEGQVVPALLDGEVVDVYTDKSYGLTVVVNSGKYTVYYSSLGSVAVQKKSTIVAGNLIGSMGICASELEPHLHLAVQTNDGQKLIDPQEIFPDIP